MHKASSDCVMAEVIWVSPFYSLMWIARGRSGRALRLRFGKHKYGFHAFGADPPHLRLRPGPLAPVPGDPHRKKE